MGGLGDFLFFTLHAVIDVDAIESTINILWSPIVRERKA